MTDFPTAMTALRDRAKGLPAAECIQGLSVAQAQWELDSMQELFDVWKRVVDDARAYPRQ